MTLINVNYYFERRQVIMFRVEDQDDGNKTELIGTCMLMMLTLMKKEQILFLQTLRFFIFLSLDGRFQSMLQLISLDLTETPLLQHLFITLLKTNLNSISMSKQYGVLGALLNNMTVTKNSQSLDLEQLLQIK